MASRFFWMQWGRASLRLQWYCSDAGDSRTSIAVIAHSSVLDVVFCFSRASWPSRTRILRSLSQMASACSWTCCHSPRTSACCTDNMQTKR